MYSSISSILNVFQADEKIFLVVECMQTLYASFISYNPVGMGSWTHRNRIRIYINNAHDVWRKGSLFRTQCLGDGIFCLKTRFGLDNRNNAFYLCGYQGLLSIFTSVPSFDLTLTSWNWLNGRYYSHFANEGMMLEESVQIRDFIMTSSSKIVVALSSIWTGCSFFSLANEMPLSFWWIESVSERPLET